MQRVRLGVAGVPVKARSAAGQTVPWVAWYWKRLLTEGGEEGRRVHAALDARFGDGVSREDLWDLAGSGEDPSLAHAAVMVWGCGSTVRAHAKHLARSLDQGRSQMLRAVVDAAGTSLSATWDALYGQRVAPPPGLGQLPFGTKWLHFSAYRLTPDDRPRPLILDRFVHAALARCCEIQMPYPARADEAAQESWIAWCTAAHEAARGTLGTATPVEPADVEYAVFMHARGTRNRPGCARARGSASAECLWKMAA